MTLPQPATPTPLSGAAAFCRLTNSHDLLDYLGLPVGADAKSAIAALGQRIYQLRESPERQEYAGELALLEDNLESFSTILSDPSVYAETVNNDLQNLESAFLELTLKVALRKGIPTEAEESVIRRTSQEYGVSDQDFDHTYNSRINKYREKTGLGKTYQSQFDSTDNPFVILGIEPTESRDDVYKAFRKQYAEAKMNPDAAASAHMVALVDAAWAELSSEANRRAYARASHSTAPPTPLRTQFLDSPTKPTSSEQIEDPNYKPLTLKLVGTRTRSVSVREKPVGVNIKVRASGSPSVWISANQPWVTISPTTFKPTGATVIVTVTVDPQGLLDGQHAAIVSLIGEDGSRESLHLKVKRKTGPGPAIARALLVLSAGVAMAPMLGWAIASLKPQAPTTLSVYVEPKVDQLLINGVPQGSGQYFEIQEPPMGVTSISAFHSAFKPYRDQLNIVIGARTTVDIIMELTAPLSFKPNNQMERGSFDDAIAFSVVRPSLADIDACLRERSLPTATTRGSLMVYINREGTPIGMQLKGTHAIKQAHSCIERYVATMRFPTIDVGEYSTVRYNFALTSDQNDL